MRPSKAIGILKLQGTLENGARHALVDLTKLFFDDYQRAAIPTHVAKLGDKYDPRACEPLCLSLRRGRLYCYDGCQRSTAMLNLGITKHDAIVFDGLKYEDEAQLFFFLNDVPRKMAGWTKFYACCRAGNKAMQMLIDIAHDHNLTLPYDPGIKKVAWADISSSLVLPEAMSLGGTKLVNAMCHVLNKAWRDPEIEDSPVYWTARKIDMMRGLIHFLKANQEMSMKKIIQTLKIHDPEKIRAIANTMPSDGRIDATQIRMAFENVLAPTPSMRKAA